MTLENIILNDDELAELKDIQDKYEVSANVLQETVQKSLMAYWMRIRKKYNLLDCPFRVIGSMVWYPSGANDEDKNEFLRMWSGIPREAVEKSNGSPLR